MIVSKPKVRRVKRMSPRIGVASLLNGLFSFVSAVAACIAAYSAFYTNQINERQTKEQLKVLYGYSSGGVFQDNSGQDYLDNPIGVGVCRLTVAINNYGGIPATLISYAATYSFDEYRLEARGARSDIHSPCDMCWADAPELVPGISHFRSAIIDEKPNNTVERLESVTQQGTPASWPPVIEPHSVKYLTIDTSFWYISGTQISSLNLDRFISSSDMKPLSEQLADGDYGSPHRGIVEVTFSFETNSQQVQSIPLACLVVDTSN